MAFNPFTTFQKNQKFWMALILMVCMITFVFCTGIGDMQDRILSRFRSSGPTVVTVARQNLSAYDLSRLRDERKAVNEFMRLASQFTVDNVTGIIQKIREKPVPKDKKEDEKQQHALVEMESVRLVLMERLQRQPLYFEGGLKLDDLVEFKLWQAQADKLGIRLIDEEVDYMTRMELFSPGFQYITTQQLQEAWYKARQGKEIGEAQMRRAITEEFRVRIARLAAIELRPGSLAVSDTGLPIPRPGVPPEERLPVTLAKLWDIYKEKRSEFDVTLIPIKVEDFTSEVAKEKGPPADIELQKLFDKYRTAKYDPAAPLPSFESPGQVKVEFIMADPTSPIYVAAARAKFLIDRTLPVVGAPMQQPLVTAARYGAFAAARATEAQRILEGLSLKKYDLFGAADLGAEHFLWPLAAHLAQRDPQAVASLVGGITMGLGDPAFGGATAFAGFLAEPMVRHASLIDAGINAESQRRMMPSAYVAAAVATGQPLDVIAAALSSLKLNDVPGNLGIGVPAPQIQAFRDFLRRDARLLLPLPILEPELEQVVQDRTAEQWASRNLLAVKRLLDNNMKPEAIKRIVSDAVPRYNLVHVVTDEFHSRYDIHKAPSLKPLREAYERYYQEINWFEKRDLTPERLLKEGDFYKLVFDNEPFASTGKYQVRPWPPDIRPNQMHVLTAMGMAQQQPVDMELLADVQKHMQHSAGQGFRLLERAQKPILFWRYDEKAPEFPKDLAAARARVVAAWEQEQAREHKVLPLAKKIADELAQGEVSPPLMDAMAVQARQPTILLRNIAPLVPKTIGDARQMRGGHRDYFPYQLPKDTISHPRDDMVQQLLGLYDLKAPIEIKLNLTTGEPAFINQLNTINKSLFDATKRAFKNDPQGHFVQVLTNQAQDVYYVAAITRPPTPDYRDFQGDVLRFASEQPERFVDSFMTRAQQMLAAEFHAKLVQQLKDELGFDLVDSEAHKTFDKDEHGS
jgi:hypothetical protein